MNLLPVPRDHELPGDTDRRAGRRGLTLLATGLVCSLIVFSQLETVWPHIVAIDGGLFIALAALLGAAMAISPIMAATGFVLALWFGVSSVYRPRHHTTPLTDKAIVATGLAIWFAPALGSLAAAINALITGRIHFVRPPRDYFMSTDPIAFWQGVGFWLITAGVLGYLAWRYWQPKLRPTPED